MVGSRFLSCCAICLPGTIVAVFVKQQRKLDAPDGSGSRNGSIPDADKDEFLSAVEAGPPSDEDKNEAAAKLEAAKEKHYQEMKRFSEMLPFRPRGQPYEAFKQRCMAFVQGTMKRASYNPERLDMVMPPCTWGEKTCKFLTQDLKDAMAKVQLPSAANLASHAEVGSSGSGSTKDEEALAVAVGVPFEKGQPTPLVPASVDDDVAGVYSECLKAGGTEDVCKNEAQKSGNQVMLMNEMYRETGAGKLDEPEKDEDLPLFGWCDKIYAILRERQMKNAVGTLVDEGKIAP